MADRYLHFTGTAPGRFLSRRLGLPQPAPLRRWTLETPALEGPLLHLTAGDSTHADTLGPVLAATGLKVTTRAERPVAVVLDATGVTTAAGLADVHAALHPVVRSLAGGGRVVVLGTAPSPDDHHQPRPSRHWKGSYARSARSSAGAPPRSWCGSPPVRTPPRPNPRCASCCPPLRVRQRPCRPAHRRRPRRGHRLGGAPVRTHRPGHRRGTRHRGVRRLRTRPGRRPGHLPGRPAGPGRNSYAPPTVWAPPPCRWTSPHPTPPT